MNLSIKNVPEEVVDRLRERARSHHRSLQGELMSLLEEHVRSERLSVEQLARRGRARNLDSPSETVQIIREMREARDRELYERATGRALNDASPHRHA